MNNAYIRPGGVAQDVPHGAVDMVREVIVELRRGLRELELLLNENPLLKGRTVGVGYLDLTGCVALGMTGGAGSRQGAGPPAGTTPQGRQRRALPPLPAWTSVASPSATRPAPPSRPAPTSPRPQPGPRHDGS